MLATVNRTLQRAVFKLLKMRGMWGGFACGRADQESVRLVQTACTARFSTEGCQ